jgi:alpha-L-rhamnosidase
MQKLIDYLESIERGGILKHGLGDWFHVDGFRAVDPVLCSTAEYYFALRTLGKIARVLEERDGRWESKAQEVQQAFQQKWYHGQGHYANDEMTALALALTCEICPESERASCAQCLDAAVKNNQYRPDFGCMGARAVPRALSDYGYAETAYRLQTQPAYPGYVDMLNHGATTLWESWDGRFSRNHTLFGDIAAWMYQTLAGIRPLEAYPGFQAISIQPFCPQDLDSVTAWRETPSGRVSVSWKKKKDLHEMTVTIPKGLPCTVILPDGKQSEQSVETAHYTW